MQNPWQYSDECERGQRDENPAPSRHSSEAQEGHHDEEPLRKRARVGDHAGPSTAPQHTGHVVDGNIARDYARVQYGDTHNTYYGTSSTAARTSASPAELLDSLSFVQMDTRQENIAKAHATTCRWLYDRPEYKAWRDPNRKVDHHGFFWIKSKPGAGKSTLMKFLLTSVKEYLPQDKIISFFFNARGEQLEQSIEGMYRHLLHQLLKTIPRLQYVLKLPNAYDAFRHGWPIEKLKSLFQEAILSLNEDRLTCFIDALDECPEDQVRDMIDFLEDLGQLSNSGAIDFHVCFASRHYPFVNIAKCQHLTLDGQDEHEQDIANYIRHKLHGKGKKLETIKVAIREKAHGVFLWAVLVVQILNKEIDRGKVHNIERRLEEIPPGLHELFQDILSRDTEDVEYLVPILRWIMFAKRPLSREELYFAIHSGAHNSVALEPWDSEEIDLSSMDLFILHCSKGLAEMTRSKKPTVQFIHESVRDYLRETGLKTLQSSSFAASDGSSHDYLKQCCWNMISQKVLQYLDLPTLLPKAKSDEAKQLRERASRLFPFLEYAYSYVIHHANLASLDGVRQARFIASFPVSAWVRIHDAFAIHGSRRLEDTLAHVLNVLAQQGSWHLFELSIRSGRYLMSQEQSEAAFRTALTSDHTDSVISLFDEFLNPPLAKLHVKTLKLAMNVNLAALRLTLKHTPQAILITHCKVILEHASHVDSPELLGCLADHGIDLSSLDSFRKRSALESAVNSGHEALVRSLLQHFKILSPSILAEPLLQALENGHLSIARLIWQKANGKGMDMSPFKDLLGNALQEALPARDPRLIERLLEYGANPSSAVCRASRAGDKASLCLLLEKGADINRAYFEGLSALHEASSAGREAVVQLLLQNGADLNVRTSEGQTALDLASSNGHDSIVALLLDESCRRQYLPGLLPQSTSGEDGQCTASIAPLLLELKSTVDARQCNDDEEVPRDLGSFQDAGSADSVGSVHSDWAYC